LAVDSAGNLFVADTDNHRIRKITSGGVVTTIAGSGRPEFADGIGTAASFRSPTAVAVNAAGNILYVSDRGNYRIRRIDLTTNNVTTFAGSGTQGVLDSNTAATARFDTPASIAVDSTGTVYVCDQGANAIRKITLLGVVSTVAGSYPTQYALGMAIDSNNNIYIAEMQAHRISKITPAGVKTILAGSGAEGSTDGTGTAASFSNPKALTVDATGTLYVADTDNSKIRRVTSSGVVTTLSLPVTLGQPLGVVADANGKLYIANTNLHTIIKTVVAAQAPATQAPATQSPAAIAAAAAEADAAAKTATAASLRTTANNKYNQAQGAQWGDSDIYDGLMFQYSQADAAATAAEATAATARAAAAKARAAVL
jgi:sugar lactone lactonase YvrE